MRHPQANYKILAARIQNDIYLLTMRLRHTTLRAEFEQTVSERARPSRLTNDGFSGTDFRITFWITSDKAVRERSGTMSLPLESLLFSLLRKGLLSQSHQTSSFTSLITVKNLVLVVGAKKCLFPSVLSNSSGLPNVLSLSLGVGLTRCGIFVVFQTSGRCTLLKGL